MELPDWEDAYARLFATNEARIRVNELGDRIINMLVRRIEQQADEIERLRGILHERRTPTCPACEFDDDALWDEA